MGGQAAPVGETCANSRTQHRNSGKFIYGCCTPNKPKPTDKSHCIRLVGVLRISRNSIVSPSIKDLRLRHQYGYFSSVIAKKALFRKGCLSRLV